MSLLYLLKPGELVLKGGNRPQFERILRSNLVALLKGTGAQISYTNGRLYVCCEEASRAGTEDALKHLAGISGWTQALRCPKTINDILETAASEARACFDKGARTFKVDCRRTDKSFPLNSYEICCAAGNHILSILPAFKVDVRKPDVHINIEIREKAYVYGFEEHGLGGLPAGTAARGLLLLSGGIDSPVAGYLMALRGMRMHALYFHSYPYASNEAREKVVELARIVGRYSMGIRLFVANFTDVQMAIKSGAPEAWRVVLLRMAMMDCAARLAHSTRCKALITGESLSQVASQTVENITCTQSRSRLPVLRPLIGMDKEAIIKLSRAIGAFETSIRPYPDCCTLFAPEHPVLHADLDEATALYESLNLGPFIEDSLRNAAS